YRCRDCERIFPKKIAERDEVGTRCHQWCNFFDRCGMSDTRNFKHFRPPADAFLDCGKAWALVRRIRVPGHDVVSSRLPDEHCNVWGCEPDGTDDAFGFELLDRVGKGLDAGEMSTVGASTRDEIGAALKQKCATSALCGNREGLGTIDQRALIDFDKAQQN